ncbi:Hypothetical protein HVR_LOCUS21 [uncultured virus]|nr:Hypothetical protein HVR_LOCUS21 [uncultured virus]
MSLDSKYFKVIGTKKAGNDYYKVIKPLGSSMILFSGVDGTPLAALHLIYKGPHDAKSLIVKRQRGKTDFQGVITKDGDHFSLVISNLTGLGMINFNIMKNDSKVVDVDPGTAKGGVNQVNELNERQSYEILCDQKDNRLFILNSAKKAGGGKVTVGEAEKDAEEQSAKFWLSVVAQVNKPELVSKFQNTYWACVDAFCIKDPIKEPVITSVSSPSGYYGGGYRGERNYFAREGCALESFGTLVEGIGPNVRSKGATRGAALERTSVSKGVQNLSSTASLEDEDEEENDTETFGPLTGQSCALFGTSIDDIVDNSWAAKIGGGRKIEVRSGFTGKTYAFDNHSTPCTLGLSVAKNLVFYDAPPDEDLMITAQSMLDEMEKQQYEQLRAALTKVYESDQCVVCLEDDKTPDTIFYACGHQCCHKNCLGTQTKCPLCRLHITARLDVAAQETARPDIAAQ